MAASPTAPQRLPRGRHKLDPGHVAAAQRRRMFEAMASVTAAKGYAAMTVADIIAAAGVSRETFYEQFRSKADGFEQAFDDASTILFSRVRRAAAEWGDAGGTVGADAFERVLGTYLESLAAEPELARLCLVEVYAAGPAMVRRRNAIQRRFGEGVERFLGASDETSRFACQALVAAISSMITTHLALGEVAELPRLREPFAELCRLALARRDTGESQEPD